MPLKPLGYKRGLMAIRSQWAILYLRTRVDDIKTTWARACEDVGIAGVMPYTLRHIAIIWAMHDGCQLAEASEFFGLSVKMLVEVYLHHLPGFGAETAEGMNRAHCTPKPADLHGWRIAIAAIY